MSGLLKPKYRWREKPGQPNMFSGFDGARQIAWIHKYHLGWWNWYMCWNHAKNVNRWVPPNGQANSAREAAVAAEQCYDAILRCDWPGMVPDDLQWMLENEKWHEGYRKLWEEALAEKGYGPNGEPLKEGNTPRQSGGYGTDPVQRMK